MRNYIALCILLAIACLNTASADIALRAGEQYEGNRMLATDEPTGEEVPAPAPDGGGGGGGDGGGGDDCADVGDRAQECGAASDTRPAECCDNLVCDGLRCVDPDDAPDEQATEPQEEPDEGTVIGREDICGEVNDRAVDCGATNPNRPQSCCDGLTCEGLFCVDPSAVDEGGTVGPGVEEGTCAADGDRSQQCGATRSDLPADCCDGLVCDVGDSVKCVQPTEELAPEEEVVVDEEEAPPAEDENCAGDNERSQQCGATNPVRPATCCSGFICDENSVKCIPAPPSTMAPSTAAPTMAPVPMPVSPPPTSLPTTIISDAVITSEPTATSIDVMTVEPTSEPTTVEPTSEPTPEVEILPGTSAAYSLATKFALTVCVAVPVFLF